MIKPLPFKQIQETKWEKWRAETFWTKEPETLKWIESFEPGSYFADVGACIGQYSLYAASLGHDVAAWEPHPFSYQALLRNIGLNGFHNSIIAVPVAAASKQKISTIQLEPGQVSGKSGVQIQQKGNFCVQCDTIKGFYDYVKIDVDGIELDIVQGMDLESPQFQSALIEVSQANQKEITEIFQEHGFKIDKRFLPWDIMTNRGLKEHSTNHRKASGSPVRNIVFTRGERT